MQLYFLLLATLRDEKPQVGYDHPTEVKNNSRMNSSPMLQKRD